MQEQRHYTVDWRFISLWMVNENTDADWYHADYRAGHYVGHRGLRIADEIRLNHGGNEAVGRWYEAVSGAFFVDGRRKDATDDTLGFFAEILESAGFDPSLVDHAEDESHDAHIRADTELALSRTGPDVGTPILTFRPGTDREGSFFGPVISKAPRGEEASQLWDAIETIAVTGVAELKRTNREKLDFT